MLFSRIALFSVFHGGNFRGHVKNAPNLQKLIPAKINSLKVSIRLKVCQKTSIPSQMLCGREVPKTFWETHWKISSID